MPELPEVETVVRGLRPYLVGRRICSARLFTRTMCDFQAGRLRGARVTAVDRRGKHVLLHLTRGRNRPTLGIHLGMTGQLLLVPPHEPRDKHTHLVLRFDGLAQELRFRDMRRLGAACLYHSPLDLEDSLLGRLGPEANSITVAQLTPILRRSSRPLKPLLMDQGKLAGLGNIYTDEALWRARLHPLRSADSLSRDEVRALARAIRSVLREAIRLQGSTVDNFVAPDGSLGRYQERHAVYQREGEPCPCCRRPIERIRLQGRGTHFCPHCQRAPSAGVGHAA
jgi:formamidopyrimidine-DNA glycosylase